MGFWKQRDNTLETNAVLEQRVKTLEAKVKTLEDKLETLMKKQMPEQARGDIQEKTKPLETKVQILEETLETLKSMQMSEQMEEFIRKKTQTLKMVNLINSVSNQPAFDFGKEEASITRLSEAKKSVDDQIKMALRNTAAFSDGFPADPRYFNYEVESGRTTDFPVKEIKALTKFIGKGLRITAYNGFDSDRVIIPSEIDGQPVISIGEKAFMNATISEVILPRSIKAILEKAFDGCKNLKHIDLPEDLEYLDSFCFSSSGLTEIAFPNSLKNIPSYCCSRCCDLETISFGDQIREINSCAFSDCKKNTFSFSS